MKAAPTTTEKLWRIAEPVCSGAGYELVDMTLVRSQRGWILRVFIDHLPGFGSIDKVGEVAGGDLGAAHSAIGFADCERVSRELSAVLDVEDPIGHAYALEVSSPGIDRPLRTLRHFEGHVGQTVKVTLRSGVAGRRNFKGALVAVTESQPSSIVMDVDGTEHVLSFGDIASARLVPDWDSLLAKGRSKELSAGGRGKAKAKAKTSADGGANANANANAAASATADAAANAIANAKANATER